MARDTRKNQERKKGLGPSGLEASLHLLASLHSIGVRDIILCPGGRNAPFIQALELESKKFNVLSFFDERAAAFFALGRARRDKLPVAISVTSGTAAAEMLPALIEAHATNIPLIAITADRPRSHRGVGSPQSMEQVNLFGMYAPTLIDWQDGEVLPEWFKGWKAMGPVHLNLCHQEPLWSKETPESVRLKKSKIKKDWGTIKCAIPKFKNPLLIVGSLEKDEVKGVKSFIHWLKADTLCEASSQLAFMGLSDKQITLSDYDAVIRLGGVPSFRLWRDLEFLNIPVLSLGRTIWSGTPKGKLFSGELAPFIATWMKSSHPIKSTKKKLNVDKLIKKYPLSEPALIHRLSTQMQKKSLVYLGNSRPLRDWNSFAHHRSGFEICDSRGLNGIDGQISTFYGLARSGLNYALLGDLTTLYDMQGPWALKYLSKKIKTRLIVINNCGGQIFKTMFPSPLFRNEHKIQFKKLAQFWGLDYSTSLDIKSDHALIEITPDAKQTALFRSEWEKLS